ncbi:glycosyltransferase [Gemmatimonas sp.]|uniref:glycosyltransferase n=1 Tax=Gemmatimonas sp. TaxID=1962908 RepID=UPI0022CCABB5|nr:glycosyltransferase [Gemmatimonas sp.]MCZ8204171.1 glycosyltransferase [Gemmatimonas sp.]
MRVLVVASTPEWTAGARLLAQLAAGLAARGDVVAMITALGSAAERAVEQGWPRLSLRSVSGAGGLRQAWSLRGIVTALRPDALLVGSERDAVLAAFAIGTRGGIVRRVAADEYVPRPGTGAVPSPAAAGAAKSAPLPWHARLALARTPITRWGDTRLALGWPSPPVEDTAAHATAIHRLPLTAPAVVLVPGRSHDEGTAAALRTLAHLRTRRPDLRVLLVGATAALQGTRLHAASLDLTAAVEIVPVEALLHHELGYACAAWITAPGDHGALATLAAMQQRLPTVVAVDAPSAELVTHGATGYHVAADNTVVVVAELARLLADVNAQRAVGGAAAARAAREFGWDALVDEAALLLARAAGVSGAGITRRPALMPA